MNQKVVLVTGSTSGIGREIAVHLAGKGAKLVVTGRNKDALDTVTTECNKVSPYSFQALPVGGDILNELDAISLLEKTIETFGRLDVLVNSAGVGLFSAINQPDLMQRYDKVMDINVKAVLRLIQLAVPHLEKTQGNIVNVSSALSMRPTAEWTIYCMSKAAMDSMTGCLALELGPKKIRVNSVNPGYTKTDFQRNMGLSEEMRNAYDTKITSTIALRKNGTTLDVAKAVEYIASDNASFITGVHLPVDGGWLYGPGVPQ